MRRSPRISRPSCGMASRSFIRLMAVRLLWPMPATAVSADNERFERDVQLLEAERPTEGPRDRGRGQCDSGFEVTVPLRFVAMVDRSTCPVVSDAFSASWAARDAVDAIRVTINAISISLSQTSIDTDTRRVYQQEYGRPLDNADKAFLAIDFSVVVVGNAACFDPCGDTGDFLCRMIQSRQWATIQACLTQAQEDAAIAALCEGGSCLFDVLTVVNGVAEPLIEDVDPCVDNTININITIS